MDDISTDLPTSMMMAAFTGIAWYIGVEINISSFLFFKRRRGLYFWSCALTSWGVVSQPLFVILADFGVWRDPVPSITMIYLTWVMMVIPQSWVLYSRLHLLMRTAKVLEAIKFVLIFNSIAFSIPTIVIGIMAQSTTAYPHLTSFNIKWDRVQLFVYFAQETALSILYIFQTRKYLQQRLLLREHAISTPSVVHDDYQGQTSEQKAVLWQLIWANTLIIALDIVVVGIQCADMFYLQGAFKPCVYGIKLKLEFVILNRLINTIQQPASGARYLRNEPESGSLAGSKGRGKNDFQSNVWHKSSGVDTREEEDAVHLEDLNVANGFRSYSAESQAPLYYGRMK